MQPPEPGIHKDVPFADYCQWDAVNASRLKLAKKSMFHFHKYESRDATHLKIGRADHTATLEPDKFMLEFTVFTSGDIPDAILEERPLKPGTSLKTRYPKQWQAFQATTNKSILTHEEYSDVLAMRNAVLTDRVARGIFRKGTPELSMVWVDPETQLTCKGRVDWLRAGRKTGRMYDLKTARDIGDDFNAAAIRYGYFLSAAFYMDGYVLARGKGSAKVTEFELVAVENVPPWDVAVRPISSEDLQRGRDEYRELLTKIANCKRAKTWPGIAGGHRLPMVYPEWAKQEDATLSWLETPV